MTEHSPFDPVTFLEEAVRQESHEDVDAMRQFLVETLERQRGIRGTNQATPEGEAAIDVSVDEYGNTIAERSSPRPEDGPHVVLNTHLDTVSPHVPFSRERNATVNGRSGVDIIRGRGACDAKGSLAGLLAAFLSVRPAIGRLTLAVTPDEETLSTGAAGLTGKLRDSDDDLSGDLYVVGEPTGLDVCTAAKGRFQGTLELGGESAHAAESDSGVNAISALEDALAAIRRFDDDVEPHPQLGDPALTPTTVQGGESTNQVPASCRLVLDRRSVPPETATGYSEKLESAVRSAVSDAVAVSFRLTDRPAPFLEAFATDPDHEFVDLLSTAATETTGGDGGAIRPFQAATEASYFAPSPTVVFGPGDLADDVGGVAHSEREYVRVEAVQQAATILTDVLGEYLGAV